MVRGVFSTGDQEIRRNQVVDSHLRDAFDKDEPLGTVPMPCPATSELLRSRRLLNRRSEDQEESNYRSSSSRACDKDQQPGICRMHVQRHQSCFVAASSQQETRRSGETKVLILIFATPVTNTSNREPGCLSSDVRLPKKGRMKECSCSPDLL
jgi:hypothetical protein